MSKSDVKFPRVVVGGFATISCTRRELAQIALRDCLEARKEQDSWLPRLVFSSNGQGVALAGRSDAFLQVMARADIIHADGMSVVFASRRTMAPLPERIPTTDFFHDVAEVANEHSLRFFMLGSTETQNVAVVTAIRKRYPGVKVVGRHHGYFSDEDDEEICRAIRRSGADVVWVALGKPRQEEWCTRNQERLRGVGWLKTCGGLYSFLTEDALRAPTWMQRSGLEWLFRLLNDPRRLLWRYLLTNPYAIYRLLRFTPRGGQPHDF